LAVVLWYPAPADEPQPAPAREDVQDLVFLGDSRPVLIRLHVRIDGQPYRRAYKEAWADYVQHLFRHLDRNGDGVLTEDEAARMPPAQPMFRGNARSTLPVNIAFNFRVVDARGDGKVTLEELLEYYRHYGGAALQVQFAPTPFGISPALNEALFSRLDRNRDGKLSRDELAAAPSLFERDLDEDELLTPQELAPDLYARTAAGMGSQSLGTRTPAAANSPFVIPSPDDEPAQLANRILSRYGPQGAPRDKTLTQAELGLDGETFALLDLNKDGRLDARELAKFADRPADVELIVRLGKIATGETPLEVLRPRGRATIASAVKTTEDGTLLMTFGRTQIELSRNAGRPAVAPGLRQRYLAHFRAADVGKKGYLTLKEAEQHGFFPAAFTLLDQNGDGQLTEKELLAYLDQVQERQARALTSTVALLISGEGSGLFELLDRNRDGRLGLREVRTAPQLLSRLGCEKKGAIARGDIPRSYRLAVGLFEASFNRFGGYGVASPRGMPLLTLDWSRPGLVWFHKMDRNHDRDVSLGEFLGSKEDFRRLDTDGDGLISLEEAERAVERYRR
jgi:Ca2+-binding EF-hand superfamily protein